MNHPQQTQSRRDSPATTAPFTLRKHFLTCCVLPRKPQDRLLHKRLLDSSCSFCPCGSMCHKIPLCRPRVRPTGTKHLENPCFLHIKWPFLSLHLPLPSLGIQRGFQPPRQCSCAFSHQARVQACFSINRCAGFKREESARGSSIPLSWEREVGTHPTYCAAQAVDNSGVYEKRRNVDCKNLLFA